MPLKASLLKNNCPDLIFRRSINQSQEWMLISGTIFKILQAPLYYIWFLSRMSGLFRVQWSHTNCQSEDRSHLKQDKDSEIHPPQTLCLRWTAVASWFLWHSSESLGSRRIVLILRLPQSVPTLMTKYRAAQIRLWLWSWCPWALVLRLTVLFWLASVNLFGGDPDGVILLCDKEYESIDLTPFQSLPCSFWAHKSNPL